MGIGMIVAAVLIVIALIFAFVFISFLKVWLRALVSGAHISLINLIGMKLRGVPPRLVVHGRIAAMKAGLQVDSDLMEAHFLAGGNLIRVIEALIAADKADIDLSFAKAAAIDLAGRNVKEAVGYSVLPKVINCPDPATGTSMLDAVARDGIRLLVKARVTVRTDLERLVGGATEDTIIARVGQGIISAIGSSASYTNVLENPDHISRKVLDSGLDAQTAFEIVSIDIADVSVAKCDDIANVGAHLEAERAETDMKMRRAEAEGRRAMARAAEQEMRARVQEMQAKVVEAQAEIPMAMAEALRKGNVGVMDFYRMQNLLADTSMRESLSATDGKTKTGDDLDD